jgi:hypothetical protein
MTQTDIMMPMERCRLGPVADLRGIVHFGGVFKHVKGVVELPLHQRCMESQRRMYNMMRPNKKIIRGRCYDNSTPI